MFLSSSHSPSAPRLLCESDVAALRRYRYSAEDRSFTYRYILSPFYTHAVRALPLWLAPNAVTLLGFLAPLLAHLCIVFLRESPFQPLPSLCHMLCAGALLWYMVLDNLDGKQARRTNTSSPLGHLFDHGCDALNVTVTGILMLPCILSPLASTGERVISSSSSSLSGIAMSVVEDLPSLSLESTLQMQPHPAFAFLFVSLAGVVPFLFATVEEFHTGSLILPHVNGPNEGLLFLSFVHLARAFNLPTPPPFQSIPSSYVIASLSLAFTLLSTRGNLSRTRQFYRKQGNEDAFDNALTHTFLPVCAVPVIQLITALLAPSFISSKHLLVPLLWQTGLLLFDAVVRVMIATLTKRSFPETTIRLPSPLAVPFVLAHAAVAVHALPLSLVEQKRTCAVVHLCVAASVLYCVLRAYRLINEITEGLNIYCFSIRKPHSLPPSTTETFTTKSKKTVHGQKTE